MADNEALVTLTADIVAAHLTHNRVSVNDVPTLISNVHAALAGLGGPQQPEAPARPEPVVSVRSSVKPDAITCLIDGTKHKMMKRHLQRAHGLTPAEYRQQFGLRDDYPMVAPNYSETRRGLAKKIGLGRKGRGRGAAEASGNGGGKEAASTGASGAGNGRRRGRPPKK
ncbi:MAG TPA: MucR family transcriptional regulator [Allosphingosinicella sp.]|jgi:predicted transcriptional regulator|nr:MucR family transcriptional regulator [Allosphingosinicella sp.]